MVSASLPEAASLRILLGTGDGAGRFADLAAGFRALGHSVTVASHGGHTDGATAPVDVDLAAPDAATRLPWLLDAHDLFVFVSGTTLLPAGLDLPLLHRAGKPIIAICHHGAVVHATAVAQQYGGPAPVAAATGAMPDLLAALQQLRLFERYATVVVNTPAHAGLALRPYQHATSPLDLAQYVASVPDRDVPTVVYAPRHASLRDVDAIPMALDRLAARGVRFELQRLDGASDDDVRAALSAADVALDACGLMDDRFVAAALASGCATAATVHADADVLWRHAPIVPLTDGALDAALERLLTDRAWRHRLASSARAHAERYHDRTAVCRRLLDALAAARAGLLRHDCVPRFAAQQYRLPPRVDVPTALRIMSSEILREHGVPDGTDLTVLTRRGMADAVTLTSGAPPVCWPADEGLAAVPSDDPEALVARWMQVRRESPPRLPRVRPLRLDAPTSRFRSLTSLEGPHRTAAAGLAALDDARAAIRCGQHAQAIGMLLPHAAQHPAARRAAALLLLGAAQFSSAEELFDLCLREGADPILSYYRAVARVLQGKAQGTVEQLTEAVRQLPLEPSLMLFGCTPIIHNRYWTAALGEAGEDARTVMTEFYSVINRREDFDHYTADFVPDWSEPRIAPALAPYHAFLFVALFGQVLHTSFDGGPLQFTACAPLEPQLLKAAGVKTVVITYGGDGAMYSRVRNASVQHAFQLSYPAAARKEAEVVERVERWNREADCIVGNIHSLDGHGRWDILVANCAQIDLSEWAPITQYSAHDGRSGPVRVLHSPNHRGVKGTEFIVAAVDALRADGLQVELQLIEGMQNHEVRECMRRADILAEQLILPFHGLSGIEGLATGLPTIANLTMEEYLQVFRRFSFLDECPVVAADPDTFASVLRRLVTDPALREVLGRAGRAYAEKYHGPATTRHLFGAVHARLRGEPVDLMNLFHPLRSDYVRDRRIVHPLVRSRLVPTSSTSAP